MLTIETTAEACAREVMETVPLVMRFIRSEIRRNSGLSVPQFRVLNLLRRCPASSLSNVADHLGVTLPTASVMMERLVRRGLVDRAEDPDERRRVVLTLTDSGKEHLQATFEANRRAVAETLAHMSPSELKKITEGARLLKSAFSQEQRNDN